MSTKLLKLLIAVMVIILVFIFGYNQWHTEDILIEMQEAYSEVSTGDVVKEEETIIYTFEMTKETLTNKVNDLIGDYAIAEVIVDECTSKVEDYKKCISDVIGVSNAESSMFKKGMYPSNNGFWLMQKTKSGYIKRKFSSVEEGIKYRVNLYAEKGRYKRMTGQDWLNWKYCTSECSGWVKAYNSAIKKLDLD